MPAGYTLTSRSYSTSSIRIATAAAVDTRGLQYSADVTDCKVGGWYGSVSSIKGMGEKAKELLRRGFESGCDGLVGRT
jgi:hypothetical protein